MAINIVRHFSSVGEPAKDLRLISETQFGKIISNDLNFREVNVCIRKIILFKKITFDYKFCEFANKFSSC